MIIIEKLMVNDYSIMCLFKVVSLFGMYYGYRIVKTFRIFMRKIE